ncbi:MAG: MFS transporter [Alphaproteobacteria bacterium]|nr:MFS transporter [Alphaproteobacteria bacterium]
MTPETHAASGRTARPGWFLLAGAVLTYTFASAVMHAYAVFLLSFLEEFGWSRADTSIAYAVSQLVGGLSSWPVGVLVDRLGPRRLLIAGGLLMAAGLALNAYADALWHVVLLYGVVMTLGNACMGSLVFAPLMARQFTRRRGMAMAVVQSAGGFGRAIAAPLAQLGISAFGWRTAYLVQAVLIAIVILPTATLFRGADTRPASRAPREAPKSPPPGAAPVTDWTLRAAMRTPHFWLLSFVYLCTSLGSFLVSLHQIAFAVDAGFERLYAAKVIGFGALMSVIGILSTGTLSDHIGRELSGILAYAVSIMGVACALFIAGPDDHLLLWAHSCLFGITWGSRGPTITAKTADLFPGPNLGAVLGVITIGSGTGAAIGSWGAGWIYDVSGSYRLAFLLSIASYLGGSIAYWAVRRPQRAVHQGRR